MASAIPAKDEKLQGRFNRAAYMYGALDAAGLLHSRTSKALGGLISDIERIYAAQQTLKFNTAGSNNGMAKGLQKPLNRLKAQFVRGVGAAERKIDKSTLPARVKQRLGL